MSLKFKRILRHRKTEIVITTGLFFLAIGLVLLPVGQLQGNRLIPLLEKLGFSLLVALIVRWLTVFLSESEEVSEETDRNEYYEAIGKARKRIWIYQTWLPGIDGNASEIAKLKVRDLHILLLSFKEPSPIYARITGRNISITTAKCNSASSVIPFVKKRKSACVKFNYGHHPAWIAVIDSFVFWGPTPIDVDSHTNESLFHKHPLSSAKGKFWKEQFELLWNEYSHTLDDEKKYNEQLREQLEAMLSNKRVVAE